MSAPQHRFDKRYPELRGTLFIVTYGRSGSTVLQNLLLTIPGAHITGENHNALAPLWQTVRRARKARAVWGKKTQPPTHPWYGADQIAADRLAERLVDAFVEEVLHPPAGARWIGFKEIRYNALGNDLEGYLDFMGRFFKNPHFIFNTRRAEDVAKSAWWKDRKREDIVKMVETMDARFQAYAEAHPETSHQIRYDELVKDPGLIAPLFDKLGEGYDEEKVRAVMDTRLTH